MLPTKLVLNPRSLASSQHIPESLLEPAHDLRPFLLVDGLWVWGWVWQGGQK